MAHNAGERESAQTADKRIETEIHTANCLYIKPDNPGTNITGTNTAVRTRAIATSAPPTSSIVSWVASTADFPSSMCRLTFSITTIASSTTVATARTIANRVRRFIDIPNMAIKINVPINETGIARRGTRVDRLSPRNR